MKVEKREVLHIKKIKKSIEDGKGDVIHIRKQESIKNRKNKFYIQKKYKKESTKDKK